VVGPAVGRVSVKFCGGKMKGSGLKMVILEGSQWKTDR
jgi:hypothetical protein